MTPLPEIEIPVRRVVRLPDSHLVVCTSDWFPTGRGPDRLGLAIGQYLLLRCTHGVHGAGSLFAFGGGWYEIAVIAWVPCGGGDHAPTWVVRPAKQDRAPNLDRPIMPPRVPLPMKDVP